MVLMNNDTAGVPEYIEVELSDFFDDSEPDDGREYDDSEVG
jgi:hypothetical protein